ncbi:MAG: NTP transferase domain-containing protein [Bacillota bacterium]|jgi:molybdenum cofactor cytidylyltransferase
MTTGAVMVAAGMSSRMKSFKPMLQLAGSTVIKTAISTLKSAKVSRIVVVTGNNAEELRRHVSDPKVACVHNKDYATTDMFYSACLGLSSIKDRADRVFFLPADVPLFSLRSLLAMMDHMDDRDCDVLVPTYRGERGHPVLLKSKAIPEIASFQGEGGLRGALDFYSGPKEFLELPDLGTVLDADRPEDYQVLKRYAKSMALEEPITCSTDVTLSRKMPFFDDKVAALLEHVANTLSISQACSAMGISYTKGWKSIKIAENHLGFPLVQSHQGGVSGGGSSLTPEAIVLLSAYRRFRQNVDEFCETEFEKFISDYKRQGEK